MSIFRIFTRDGYEISWAPTFASEAEAEAWISEIGNDWDEPVEAVEFADN
jgi:hypothetical protein